MSIDEFAKALRQDAMWLLNNTSTETNGMVARLLTAATVMERLGAAEQRSEAAS